MIKFENTVTPSAAQWKSAIMGTRNPLNSWHKSDSVVKNIVLTNHEIAPGVTTLDYDFCEPYISIGPNDITLMKKLARAGADHRKFMRMLTVHVDITAPLYWWKEFSTYKVGTVANSCSTMHKIHEKEFMLSDFSYEHLMCLDDDRELFIDMSGIGDESSIYSPVGYFDNLVRLLNKCREKYLETKNKKYWWQMIQLLPTSYNQKRTVMLNYEVLANIYKARKNHKLNEWLAFSDWIEELPYSELIINTDDTSFQEDLEFFVNDCTNAQLRALYERVGERLKEKDEDSNENPL